MLITLHARLVGWSGRLLPVGDEWFETYFGEPE